MSSFCSAKATHIFSAKNIRILYIESAKSVNKMTLNELVKLTDNALNNWALFATHPVVSRIIERQRDFFKFRISMVRC